MSPPCTLSERPLRRTFIRTNAAAGHTGIRPYADGFNVVGCTATRNSFTEGLLPGVDARDNTSTTGTGVPIYWLKGARVANNYADFYDGSWDDEANVKNESGSNGLDTNTRRIARRVLGEVPRPPDWRLRSSLHELAGPRGSDIQWNQSLLDLGALVCRARAPRCGECPVRSHCATGRVRG